MRVVLALFSIVVLAGGLAAGGWYYLQSSLRAPSDVADETLFVVERGEGLSGIADRLQAEGLIANADHIKIAARLGGVDTAVKAGEYAIPPRSSAARILSLLTEGDVVDYRITLAEGLTTAQILRKIEAEERLTGPLPDPTPAEGTLLPDTYSFTRGETRAALVDRMAKAQTDLLADLWPGRRADLPVSSPEEAVILASVVEKETGVAGERGLIAGVFTNRLKRGIRLQSDPTIIYGVSKGEPLYNKRGQRRTLYRSEIDRETPWNTYQIDGLPITPICNPGRDAIAAVLNPEDTDYLFFVADGTGGHAFAKTNAEHLKNVRAYRRIEAARIAEERAQ